MARQLLPQLRCQRPLCRLGHHPTPLNLTPTMSHITVPQPHPVEVEGWRSEASMYDHPDSCDAHVAQRAAAWGAAAGIAAALKDTAHCHWRVAGGEEDGVQLVRASDLMAWAEQVRQSAVYNDPEADD